jgi:hypothetical protein
VKAIEMQLEPASREPIGDGFVQYEPPFCDKQTSLRGRAIDGPLNQISFPVVVICLIPQEVEAKVGFAHFMVTDTVVNRSSKFDDARQFSRNVY